LAGRPYEVGGDPVLARRVGDVLDRDRIVVIDPAPVDEPQGLRGVVAERARRGRAVRAPPPPAAGPPPQHAKRAAQGTLHADTAKHRLAVTLPVVARRTDGQAMRSRTF